MGCTRANTDGNGEYREADKNGSVLARTPHFGHGACVTYRETPHPSSVSPMAICIQSSTSITAPVLSTAGAIPEFSPWGSPPIP